MIVIGAVTSAHGVRGQFKVKPFTSVAEDVASYGPVCLDDGRWLQLTVKAAAKHLLICEADGITDRSAAEALRGQTLSVNRDTLPELAQDEHYHADLIGLAVQRDDGTELGRVVGLHNFGAGEILEVAEPGLGKARTEMYPFYPPFLLEIDLDAGQILLASGSAASDEPADEPADEFGYGKGGKAEDDG